MESHSAAVVDKNKTHVFFNALDPYGKKIMRIMTYNHETGQGEGSRAFIVGSGSDPVPASEGPIAACNIETGIRVYVINDNTIVEYGKDENSDWKREIFTGTPIKLAPNSNLNALGVEYAGQKYKGDYIKIRLFYVEASASKEVTMNTFTGSRGWTAEKLIS